MASGALVSTSEHHCFLTLANVKATRRLIWEVRSHIVLDQAEKLRLQVSHVQQSRQCHANSLAASISEQLCRASELVVGSQMRLEQTSQRLLQTRAELKRLRRKLLLLSLREQQGFERWL